MTISERLTELRAENPAWNIENVDIRPLPWCGFREPSTGWIGGHSVVEAKSPGQLERLMTQAVGLTALAPGATVMPHAECMERLTFLRRQFPDRLFKLRDHRPLWHGRRRSVDSGRAAAITEVRGNDSDEPPLLLMRIPRAEVGIDEVEEDGR